MSRILIPRILARWILALGFLLGSLPGSRLLAENATVATDNNSLPTAKADSTAETKPESAKLREKSKTARNKQAADKSSNSKPSPSKPAASNASASNKTPAAKPKKVRLAHIAIEGQLPESAGMMSLFGDLGIDLRKTVSRIDKVAGDDSVAGLILDIRSATLSRGKLHELSAAVGRVRASGKKVIATLESAMGSQYLLASACDEIVMPESGMVLITGVELQFVYLKDLLTKLGMEADIIKVGDYKGAAETLSRSTMSEPVRKNMTALVDDLYDQMLTTIAQNRQLRVEEVTEAIDQGLFTTEQAQKSGLIDRVLYPDALRKHLATRHETDQLVYVMNYAKKKVDTDFSGPMGMMKLFQAILGAGSRGSKDKGPQIGLVYAVGPIMSGKSQNGALGGSSMGSTTIVKALQEAARDERVKAIVLRVNSPGGSALASDLIWRTTKTIDKPIVASMGDVAASGGYYISMGADRIVAEPGTITGSIGVVGGKVTMGGLQEKIGFATEVIGRGKNSGIFSGISNFSESQREVISHMMQNVYQQFTTKAAAGRKLPLERLETLAGGQVYTGRVAKRHGLVDELGTLKDAIGIAKQLAGLGADDKVGLKVLPKPENPLEVLFGADLDEEREARIVLGSLARMLPDLGSHLRHAIEGYQVMREPVLVMMPYWIEVR
jgi:protease-4